MPKKIFYISIQTLALSFVERTRIFINLLDGTTCRDIKMPNRIIITNKFANIKGMEKEAEELEKKARQSMICVVKKERPKKKDKDS